MKWTDHVTQYITTCKAWTNCSMFMILQLDQLHMWSGCSHAKFAAWLHPVPGRSPARLRSSTGWTAVGLTWQGQQDVQTRGLVNRIYSWQWGKKTLTTDTRKRKKKTWLEKVMQSWAGRKGSNSHYVEISVQQKDDWLCILWLRLGTWKSLPAKSDKSYVKTQDTRGRKNIWFFNLNSVLSN